LLSYYFFHLCYGIYNQPLTTLPLTFDLPRDGLPCISTLSTCGGFNVSSFFGGASFGLAVVSGFGGSTGDFTSFSSVLVAAGGGGATVFAGSLGFSGAGVGLVSGTFAGAASGAGFDLAGVDLVVGAGVGVAGTAAGVDLSTAVGGTLSSFLIFGIINLTYACRVALVSSPKLGLYSEKNCKDK
jgi:hypothetical protein